MYGVNNKLLRSLIFFYMVLDTEWPPQAFLACKAVRLREHLPLPNFLLNFPKFKFMMAHDSVTPHALNRLQIGFAYESPTVGLSYEPCQTHAELSMNCHNLTINKYPLHFMIFYVLSKHAYVLDA